MATSTEIHIAEQNENLNGVTSDASDALDEYTLDGNNSNDENNATLNNLTNVAEVVIKKSTTLDEIPEPIKVLDDIISEFEDTSKPVLINNGENQSEDDGYMSLSRKNINKENSEEISIASADKEEEEEDEVELEENAPVLTLPVPIKSPTNDIVDTSITSSIQSNDNEINATVLDETDVINTVAAGITTEITTGTTIGETIELTTDTNTERTIEVATTRTTTGITTGTTIETTTDTIAVTNGKSIDNNSQQQLAKDITTVNSNDGSEKNIVQSTLPKVRPSIANNTSYSSLPCSGLRSNSVDSKLRGGVSFNGGRNKLGIDISAVHKAVLRGGVAKLPEPILNEHPITIYPGSYSPTESGHRGNRSQRHQSSVEKHKEMCHILKPLSSMSSSSSSPNSASSDNKKLLIITKENIDVACKQNIYTTKNLIEYDYSDDSLDGRSLSPVTSSATELLTPKRNAGIAWEIHFDRVGFINKKKSKAPVLKKANKKKLYEPNNIYETKAVSNLCYGDEFINVDYSSTEDLNESMYRPTNMLGKGTFIIKRATHKKPTRVIDIFNTAPTTENHNHNVDVDDDDDDDDDDDVDGVMAPPETKEHNIWEYETREYVNEAERKHMLSCKVETESKRTWERDRGTEEQRLQHCERTPDVEHMEFMAVETHNFSKKSEAINLKTQKLNKESNSHSHSASVTSPREKLSLNIESKYKKPELITTTQIKSPIEDFKRNSVQKGATSKINENLARDKHRTDKITISASEELLEKPDYETGNASYAYKSNNSSGLKSQDYNDLRTSNSTTPHTDLAPTLEEDEELSDLSYSCAPLKQIESNISALLRGEITVVRTGDVKAAQPKRVLEFRPGVHKSESAKEMLLSQNMFGPLPPSPPSSNPDLFDYDAPLPPLPPSPSNKLIEEEITTKASKKNVTTTAVEIHTPQLQLKSNEKTRSRDNIRTVRHFNDELPLPPAPFENLPPAVPPHRIGYSANTMKSWSIDSNYKRRSPKLLGYGSGITTPTGGPPHGGATNEQGMHSAKRYVGSYGTKRSLKQSPREEHRLQTSCSLPETPIFARGCDIPRTPYRRQPENTVTGSRTAPRSSTSHSINMGNSIVGIAGSSVYGTGICRQRSINHALASNEMLRLSGMPARGWYPKQRSMRPASTENIDRLTTMRVWDTGTVMSNAAHARKPCTLPPNLTPSFLNKSPREALRRVTSLLITKKKNSKERKSKPCGDSVKQAANYVHEMEANSIAKETNIQTCQKPKTQKKKGLFKSLWKKTKHFSLDQ